MDDKMGEVQTKIMSGNVSRVSKPDRASGNVSRVSKPDRNVSRVSKPDRTLPDGRSGLETRWSVGFGNPTYVTQPF